MRILLIGRNGQLGWELCRSLSSLGSLVAVDQEEINFSLPSCIPAFLKELDPDLIVNASAYTAVDRAETDFDAAQRINAESQAVLAEEAKRRRAAFITYSTDYVFAGDLQRPYVETDLPSPINQYGRTKLMGEKAVTASGAAHLILRTSWLYGSRGSNFLLTMLRLGRERPEIRVVDDQVGSPTWCRTLAEVTAQIVAQVRPQQDRDWGKLRERSGVYHATSCGRTSWYGFARSIFELAGIASPCVVPITTAEYPTAAARPAWSVLDCNRLQETFGLKFPDWRVSLSNVIEDLRATGSPLLMQASAVPSSAKEAVRD